MDQAAFEAGLERDGFAEVFTRRMEPGQELHDHTHPFDARVLILEGEYLLEQDGTTRRFLPGEHFEVPAGVPHAESFGPHGASFIVGRRAKG
jgi:quercetin dioxygenase-like cupin family protein